jgi:hypothetical protein
MSTPIATYSFLPWLRQGLANQITSHDFDNNVKVRAQVTVALEAKGDRIGGGTETVKVSQEVSLFGPGDIVGVERATIVRVEPRDGNANFEPNYLAQIEFYDEDFPWRYTPAASDTATNGRLRPWMALVVLAEGEFTDGKNIKDKPLPYVDVLNISVFPRADELWAWAHVHVNRSLSANESEFHSKDMAAVLPKLQAVLKENPDLAFSRLLCPRKLAQNTAYHAFLIPTFESGRRAGLHLDLADVAATMSSWDPAPRPEGLSFPYYHRWAFRTGLSGDFETLVKLIVPKPVDPRVGFREMDVQDPGSNVPGVDDPALGGILKLGGALQPPAKKPKEPPEEPPEPPDKFETWDVPFPHPLQVGLAHIINLPEVYEREGHPDPIITPPLYGTWHAMTKRVLTEADDTPAANLENWVHRLNLDPRFRVAAGFGTRVIQDQQEKFMDAAWAQIGNVLEAQKRVWRGQFSLLVSEIWYDRHLMPTVGVSRQQTLLLMAPLNKRLLTAGSTVHFTLGESFVQPAMTSAALRRMIRPRARLVRSLPFTAAQPVSALIDRVNAGDVSAAPPKLTPPGVVTADEVAGAVVPNDAPPWVIDALRRYPSLPTIVLAIAILLALLLFLLLPGAIGLLLAGLVVAGGIAIYRRLTRWKNAIAAADSITEGNQTPAAIDQLPGNSGFTIVEPGSGVVSLPGGTDSVEATRFKQALRETFTLVQASNAAGRVAAKRSLDLAALVNDQIQSTLPARTVPRRVMAGISMPPRVSGDIVKPPAETFVEPMAYPVIDQPMYEPLKNLSSELFLPNINLIEPNSITLLETNQRFIESYMVGLNHEFARELLWREYPTDSRGSTFRQFWDVRGFFNTTTLDNEARKESLRDIPPLHVWPPTSLLGTHDNREQGRENEDELVLVIRGELLKRYPNAVIYAHRACWQRKAVLPADKDRLPCDRSGVIDNTLERRFATLTAAEEANPPRTKVLTPLFEAKVDPDIFFFGFDLTADEAKGGTGEKPDDDPGWFFVIKQRPGEPRFGLDTEEAPLIQVWNDLSWPKIQPKPPGANIEIATAPATITVTDPGAADEKHPQYLNDKFVKWDRSTMSSAELAYIFFQAPVLVGVHAGEMLPK